MKLVHCDVADVGPLALAKGRVRQDLGRAADDHGARVDGGVACDHADVFLAEDVAQVEELLADQGFDGGGVVRLPSLAQGEEVHAEGNHRLAGTRGGAQDDVVAQDEVHDGFFLVGPQLDATVEAPLHEELEDLVARHLGVALMPDGGAPAQRARSKSVVRRALGFDSLVGHGRPFLSWMCEMRGACKRGVR